MVGGRIGRRRACGGVGRVESDGHELVHLSTHRAIQGRGWWRGHRRRGGGDAWRLRRVDGSSSREVGADELVVRRAVRVEALGEVDVGRGVHAPCRWHPDVVGTGRRGAAADVGAHPRVRVDAALANELLRPDDVRAAAEGQDAHHLGLLATHHLKASEVAVGRAGGAVEHVDAVLHSLGPEGDRKVARDQVDAHLLHHRADGSLCDAVELVDVRRACRLMDALGCQ